MARHPRRFLVLLVVLVATGSLLGPATTALAHVRSAPAAAPAGASGIRSGRHVEVAPSPSTPAGPRRATVRAARCRPVVHRARSGRRWFWPCWLVSAARAATGPHRGARASSSPSSRLRSECALGPSSGRSARRVHLRGGRRFGARTGAADRSPSPRSGSRLRSAPSSRRSPIGPVAVRFAPTRGALLPPPSSPSPSPLRVLTRALARWLSSRAVRAGPGPRSAQPWRRRSGARTMMGLRFSAIRTGDGIRTGSHRHRRHRRAGAGDADPHAGPVRRARRARPAAPRRPCRRSRSTSAATAQAHRDPDAGGACTSARRENRKSRRQSRCRSPRRRPHPSPPHRSHRPWRPRRVARRRVVRP